MSRYYFARDYAYNVFRVAEKDALVIAQYDPEFFPLVYYQDVEHERPDLVIVNPLLLMRSWYIGVLKNRHPDLVAASAKEAAEFLRALEPFEKKQAYDGIYIQTKFDALLNSFIDGELRLRGYEVPSAKIDFPARYMKRRIWSLLLMRGNQLEAAGQKANADRFFEEDARLRE